jgi:hypothetical protein
MVAAQIHARSFFTTYGTVGLMTIRPLIGPFHSATVVGTVDLKRLMYGKDKSTEYKMPQHKICTLN